MIQTSGLVVALLCLSVLLGGCQAGLKGRILGGDEAGPTDTPYAASLRVDNAHVCGASIVSATKLVTTAHCLYRDGKLIEPSRLTCRVGSTNQYAGGKVVYVESVTVHPDFYQLQNNVAVITLTSALAFTDRIMAVELASSDDDLPAQGSLISVAGWGRTVEGSNSYKIRELTLTVAEEAVCLDAYSAHDKTSFCLAHELKQGTCHGDGGSGAVYNNKLIGLTNFVVGACGSRYPDVFVRVSSFYEWLQPLIA
ncbi:chymotrypsin-1 [Drosophila pseudoobscura]|uniref:trypsin n=1 Tax=Drosophila pseudoobscura pseudoobscura TaxID=46245 RepID=A0A6I8UYZ0_DROPS|nr:chymotrypsin-1 [Drosophila pseudoobscura]